MTATPAAARRPARERLLDAADELFYAEGVQSVGIDRIVERAGVAKASLYNTFGSKEALVQAYLEARHAATKQRLTAALETIPDPRQRLLGVFDIQARVFADPRFHGCAFIAASAEAPPGGAIEQAAAEYRGWVRDLFTELARAAGVCRPEELARQLHLLYDGALLAADLDHNPDIATSARAAAAALLDSAVH